MPEGFPRTVAFRPAAMIMAICSLLFLLGAQMTAAPVASSQGVPVAMAKPAVVIAIKGEIDDYSGKVVLAHLEQAKREGAEVVIFELNTPGGGVGATLEMTRAVRLVQGMKT